MSFILELPAFASFAIICCVTVLIVVIGLRFVRKRYPQEVLKENHEVAAVMFNAFGLLYAIVVAFVVFATWGRYDDAGKDLELEASQAADIFFVARAFPDSTRKQIRQALLEYTSSVVEDEFMTMSQGKASTKTIEAISKLNHIFLTMDTKGMANTVVYEESFKRLNDLGQYRRLRIFASKDSIPSVIWLVLIAGAVIMVSYTYFFGIKKVLPQNLMTAALTITVTLILFLIFILDHPFVGSAAVSSDPMKQVMETMKKGVANDNAPPK
jgi:Protein of unknown function (DUF4239)